MRTFEIAGHREHHLAKVTPRRVRSVPVEMFDREHEPLDEVVKLTRLQGQLIASLLNAARGHLPSPKACDQAIELLTPFNNRRNQP